MESSTFANRSAAAALQNSKASRPPRPKLTAENAVAYLDWVTSQTGSLSAAELDVHLRAVELAIRTLMHEAQNKATQHTLVEQGIIDPPPTAS